MDMHEITGKPPHWPKSHKAQDSSKVNQLPACVGNPQQHARQGGDWVNEMMVAVAGDAK